MNKKHGSPLIAFFSGALMVIFGAFLAFSFNIYYSTLKENAERIKLANALYIDINNKMITMYASIINHPFQGTNSFTYMPFDFDIYETFLQEFLLFPEDNFRQIIKFYGLLQQYHNSANLFFTKPDTIDKEGIILNCHKNIFISIITGNKILDSLEKQYKNITLQEIDKNRIKDLKERVFQKYPELSQSTLPKKLFEAINKNLNKIE